MTLLLILTGWGEAAPAIPVDGIVFLHLPARSTTLHLDTRTGYQIAPYDAFTGSLWYASPTGTAGGDGSFASPYDLDTIIGASSPVQPGDTVYLRGGTYSSLVAGISGTGQANDGIAGVAGKGVYNFEAAGTSGSNIVLRSCPGEWAIINAGVHVINTHGEYITFKDMEIKATPTTRVFANSNLIDYPAIYITAPGVKFINVYYHDLSGFYPMMAAAGGFEWHGCIGQNIGYYTSDVNKNRNYIVYSHNDPGGAMLFKKGAFITPFESWGMCAFSGASSNVQDYDVQYNAFFEAGQLFGSATKTTKNNIFSHNSSYGKTVYYAPDGGKVFRMGSSDIATNLDITAEHNYLAQQLSPVTMLNYARQATFRHNVCVLNNSPTNTQVTHFRYQNTAGDIALDYSDNTYHHVSNQSRFAFNVPTSAYRTFAQWQALGFDADSTYSASLPTANVVRVVNNDYETGRGMVTVYNWEGLNSVSVDLSTLTITSGARCRLRNVLNYDEYVDFTYTGDNLSISMQAGDWSLKTPTAYDSPSSWYTEPYPQFGIFQVETLDTGTGLHLPTRSTTLEIAER